MLEFHIAIMPVLKPLDLSSNMKIANFLMNVIRRALSQFTTPCHEAAVLAQYHVNKAIKLVKEINKNFIDTLTITFDDKINGMMLVVNK